MTPEEPAPENLSEATAEQPISPSKPPAEPPTAAPEAAAEETPAAKPAAKRPPKAASTDAEGEAEPAAKPKKEKPPAPEDKPFADFIQQDYLPALQTGLTQQGLTGVDLQLEKRAVNIVGLTQVPECWQVVGRWRSQNQPREFNIYFFQESIQGQKGFSQSETGKLPSTLESFLIDERKVDLNLLVQGTLRRLNGQKWLARN